MKPFTFLHDRVCSFIARMGLGIMARSDDDFKRMCVLAIIHSKWVGGDIAKDRYVKAVALNKQMGLVKDPSALKFPVCIADYCLTDIPSLSEASNEPNGAWERIRMCIPSWLRYSDDSTIRRDIQRVFAIALPTPIVCA